MYDGVTQLLADGGIDVRTSARGYRPTVSLDGVETKVLKPQNIVRMLDRGSRDVGFAGADWVAEREAQLVEVLDTELDPVRIVAAAPVGLLDDSPFPAGTWVVASEYERLTQTWVTERGYDMTFVRSYGATEVFPPEDADCIVDNTATGATLRANGLRIFDELMRSSTRLYASREAMDDPRRRDRIEHIALVLRSVLDARARVMVEVNVGAGELDAVIAVLPCMRQPTISRLHGEDAYAIKAAVPRAGLPELVRQLKQQGATDLVVTRLSQIVP
jgi:ATP phosphoribosyltransferase